MIYEKKHTESLWLVPAVQPDARLTLCSCSVIRLQLVFIKAVVSYFWWFSGVCHQLCHSEINYNMPLQWKNKTFFQLVCCRLRLKASSLTVSRGCWGGWSLLKMRLSYRRLCTCLSVQVSSEAEPVVQSDAQTFTIGVMPQIPGFPQLAPDCDLQITVRGKTRKKTPWWKPWHAETMASTTDDVVIVSYTATIMHILFNLHCRPIYCIIFSFLHENVTFRFSPLKPLYFIVHCFGCCNTVKYIFPYFSLNYMIICENSAIVLTVNNHQLIFFGF